MFMSLKLLKLRCKIFIWSLTGKIKKIHPRLQLSLIQGNHNNILIIFPNDESSFRVANYTFRNLGKKSSRKKNIKILVEEQFEHLFHLRTSETIFIHETDPDRILTDEKSVMLDLQQKEYDIIVDLNPKFHLGVARLVSKLSAEMKVGFASEFSDQFYNIQLDISRSGIMEKGFKQINWILAQ